MGIVPSVLAALLLISGGLGIYANHLRGEVMEQKELVASKEETIVELRGQAEQLIDGLAAMRDSRDTVNARLKTMVAEHNAAVEAEIERRRLVAIERDKSREALRIALDAIGSESAINDDFKTWLAQPVPRAAWDRLRDAAE